MSEDAEREATRELDRLERMSAWQPGSDRGADLYRLADRFAVERRRAWTISISTRSPACSTRTTSAWRR